MNEWLEDIQRRKPWLMHAVGVVGKVSEVYQTEDQRWCIRFEDQNAFLADQANFVDIDQNSVSFYLQTVSLLQHMTKELIKFGNALEVDRKFQAKILASLFARQVEILNNIQF